jgi:hypothetical protein
MKNKIEEMIKELQSIEAKAVLPPKFTPAKDASVFGRTSELQAVITEIRKIESSHPSVTKFTAPSIPAGNLCNKSDLIRAKNHLQQLKVSKPGATVRKSIAAITKPKAATTRTAQEIMQLPAKELQQLRNRASARGSKAAQEIKAAHASCEDPALRFQLFQAFRTILTH